MNDERGEITIVGLLTATVLFLAVMGATLEVFASSEVLRRDTQERNDSQDRARVAVDTAARQLRNLASPTHDQPQALERAPPHDLVFKTVEPNSVAVAGEANVKRVRYCVSASSVLWKQQMTVAATTAAPTIAADASCPGSGQWSGVAGQAMADRVVNYADGRSVPIFTYNSPDLRAITSVHIDVLVDADTGGAAATRLSSGVFLRNQNRAPSAAFGVTQTASGLMLNGSLSTDPEGDPLTYCWYDTARAGSNPPAGSPCRGNGEYVAENITHHYEVANGTTHGIWLEVRDAVGLLGGGISTRQNITKQAPS